FQCRPRGKKRSIFKPIAAWFGGVGNWARDRPGICSAQRIRAFGDARWRIHRNLTPPLGGGEGAARSVNARWSMPNSRGRGWHFQYTLSPTFRPRATIAVLAGNPDAVPAYVQNKSQPIHDPT